MTAPLGCNRCAHCGRISEVYNTWPTCRECLDEICDQCDVPTTRSEDEAHRTTCQRCAEAAA